MSRDQKLVVMVAMIQSSDYVFWPNDYVSGNYYIMFLNGSESVALPVMGWRWVWSGGDTACCSSSEFWLYVVYLHTDVKMAFSWMT